ncbi:DUF29 domain-containing protein [Thiocapsa sp.]|uniref:DUF29 domain-containing protein n=1 Tax=Thiocapsa sp. TaxID=2024551 RepID=UPI002D1B86E6|nr:DUF29 domain-containing protein [Thiocapsa sp.]HSO83574.1 DUF29 domain-containing protein [Thiocapsa sp.]
MTTDYDQDFYAWSREQASLLRSGQYGRLDVMHLVEEIEDLGKRERRALESRLAVLLGHLLKWQYQPEYPSRKSWRATINTQRRAIAKLLDENPSLAARLDEIIRDAYPDAVDLAVAETPLDYDAFPVGCPWDQTQILGTFLPG